MEIKLRRVALTGFIVLVGYLFIPYILSYTNRKQDKSVITKTYEPFVPEKVEASIQRHHGADAKQDTAISEAAWSAKMIRKQEDRKSRLRRVCSMLYNRTVKDTEYLTVHKNQLLSFIVNDKFKFIYNVVYKVGSSNWERVIVQDLEGFQNVPNQKFYSHKALTFMSTFSDEGIKERLQQYTKFVFVRNPLSRILSAYQDKFVDHHNSFYSSLARRIIKQYRNDSAADDTNANVTFTEFVKYLVDSEGNRDNPHWVPYYVRNMPCEVEYDIIGKLDEADDDIPYVLKTIGIWNMTDYGKGQPVRQITDAELVKLHYSQIPQRLLQELYIIYGPDFRMFDYAMPPFPEKTYPW